MRTEEAQTRSGTKNGPLLRLTAQQFDIFLTVDQGLEYQQNLAGLNLAIIAMAAKSNDIDDLRPLMPRVLQAVEKATAGTVVKIQL